ncbi:tRNA modification GTPase GTPBP3, mitochondrial-like isoform X2 [Ostrea edulis]|uniref:tRNA modification GTPase GTPBP3, mitochondrial-like isoform X2 n=1 Tax=Ostrea edulis TaxID=37623 RepID=UPI0024AF6E97|nr:tRNA modification GTPase GTPBP3, mitochondrial-like isoform X2 [Ostrea edulis]
MSRYRFFRNLSRAGGVLGFESMSVKLNVSRTARRQLATSRDVFKRSVHTSTQRGDTIFALSSGQGRCGVAVIRVSGPQAKESIYQMCSTPNLLSPRTTILQRVVDPSTREPIDRGLVVWFPSPESFTGEDCVEFQVHGGPAVIAAMVTSLGRLPKYRHAEAGEFTKRAFMNGKLDLTEVEGLGDLIHAETEAQRKQALRQMEGDLGKLYRGWRKRVIKAAANVEAYIDFAESDTLEEDLLLEVSAEVDRLKTEIEHHLRDHRRGERLRDGVHVVIVGRPNVGKSTLLNSICQRPAAIVSPIPGTTRDVVETTLNVGGYPVLLSDTAGLRETEDIIEKEGVVRAVQRAEQADLQILVLEATHLCKCSNMESVEDIIRDHFTDLGLLLKTEVLADTSSMDNDSKASHLLSNNEIQGDLDISVDADDLLVVVNKCDLIEDSDLGSIQRLLQENKHFSACCISCTSGQGIEEFLEILQQRLRTMCGNPLSGNPSLTQARHRFHLEKCQGHLERYKRYMELGDVVLAAQNLRKVLYDIGKITGKITSEEILDIIFKDFCIGK